MYSQIILSFKQIVMVLSLILLSLAAKAQSGEQDISKLDHFKFRAYLKENGLKTQSGKVVRVGDERTIGKGSLPDKRYTFIYQPQTGVGYGTSKDGSVKAFMNSE